jgi:hypothetical protein
LKSLHRFFFSCLHFLPLCVITGFPLHACQWVR